MFRNAARSILLLASCSLVCIEGCGTSASTGPQRFAAEGKILYNGQPPKGAVVQLWPLPIDRSKWQERKPTGQVKEDGSFTLWTATANDGALPGEYAVTLLWDSSGDDNPPGNDVFGGRFSNPDQPISKVTIKPEANTLPAIELTGPAVAPPGGGR